MLLIQLMYIPLVVIWFIYLLIKSKKASKICLIIICIYSFFLFLNSVSSLVSPYQDFIPGWGVAVSTLFFPLILTLAYLTKPKRTL